ncbi:hypothetical protein [Pararhodospirillum photometricum]|uniref:DUF4376 domain-containing protein n=1 Tax=Pararhodospirillum photometricum TaxID=1084 RepID=UPI000685FA9B|nr:hypothetical protein [Pararhodospirillum photometricum]
MSETILFSKSLNAFYLLSLREKYSSQWPEDLIEVPHDRHQEILAQTAAGGTLSASDDGTPVVVPPPSPSLQMVKAQAVGELKRACETEITGGFQTPANRHYPSTSTDQNNLVQATVAGGPLWCREAGVWQFVEHTADQAAEVLACFVATRATYQKRLAELTTAVEQATSAEQLTTIQWNQEQ